MITDAIKVTKGACNMCWWIGYHIYYSRPVRWVRVRLGIV